MICGARVEALEIKLQKMINLRLRLRLVMLITPNGVFVYLFCILILCRYLDVLHQSDMVDTSPVRGCMIIKPWAMHVWDSIRNRLDEDFKDYGVNNAYFPLFIPLSFLSKEAQHVEGFAQECAVVTHHRLHRNDNQICVDPQSRLAEPLVVRPTSETVIWSSFQKWIQSHRDLPLLMNQWANVVRWEMRTRPFLRTSEFLWQEGHTAHVSEAEADDTARHILQVYSSMCKDILALPTIPGSKSPSERFAGAMETYTIEGLMQNGWALQCGTSHCLGQNFSRAFDVRYQSESGDLLYVWATSWGVSTRLIGAMVMTHSDDKGLVLPPHVAPVQVVIVPIISASMEANVRDAITERVNSIQASLRVKKIRVKVDDRLNVRPGAKYFEWEKKGVPLRIEIGARDISQDKAVVAIRHSQEKLSLTGAIDGNRIDAILQKVHEDMYAKAQQRLETGIIRLDKYSDMKEMLASSDSETNTLGFYLVPWKDSAVNEAAIKSDCKATVRCFPFEHNADPPAAGVKCFYSGEQATHMAIFARAY